MARDKHFLQCTSPRGGFVIQGWLPLGLMSHAIN